MIEPRSLLQPVFFIFVERTSRELFIPLAQPIAVIKPSKLKKQSRSRTEPVPSEPQKEPPKRRLSWPALSALYVLPQPDGEEDQPKQRFGDHEKSQPARGWRRLPEVVGALRRILLLKKLRVQLMNPTIALTVFGVAFGWLLDRFWIAFRR